MQSNLRAGGPLAAPQTAAGCSALRFAGLAIGLAAWPLAAGAQVPVRPFLPAELSLARPVAVFGSDDRLPLPKRYERLRNSLGVLLNPRTSSMCSAFCVGDDIVATAAHCMFRTASEPLPRAADVVFARSREEPGSQSRIAGYGTGAAAQHVASGSMRLSIKPPIEASKDWALVRLAEPVCRGAALPVRAVEPDRLEREAKANRVFQLAFHRDYESWKIAYSQPCSVKRDFDGAAWRAIARDFTEAELLILHLCDTGGASSGSPILLDTAEGPVVVGINVGTYVQSKVMIENGEVVHRSRADAIANTAVSAAAFQDRLLSFRDAVIIISDKRLKVLQSRLKVRGLYSGAVDGSYGPQLKAAIEDYERSERLQVTGLATETLLQRLGDGRYEGLPPREPESGAGGQSRRVVERSTVRPKGARGG